jgi:uncharacterized protein (DUF4415 family)
MPRDEFGESCMSERLSQYTIEELEQKRSRGEDRTDWRRIDRLSEAELRAAIDAADEGEFDWSKVEVGMPTSKQQLTVRFDLDVINWFRAQGAGYQTKMNQVLRSYVEAHRKK